MAGTTTRLVLPYPSAPDSNNVPQDLQRLATLIDSIGMVFLQGSLPSRPAAATPGRFYAATDQNPVGVYYDTGTAWVLTNASLTATFTAKGDVLAATAAGTPARVAVGTDGQSLNARASYAAGVGWEPVLGLPLGLPGATAAARFAGGTVTGAPTTGTFAVGDLVISQDGGQWICTAAGTPGTFSQTSGAGGPIVQASNYASTTGPTASPPAGDTTVSATTAVVSVTNPSTTRSMLVRATLQGYMTWTTNNTSTVLYTAAYTVDLKKNGVSLDPGTAKAAFMYTNTYHRRDYNSSFTVIPPSGTINFQGTASTIISYPGGGTSVLFTNSAKAYLNVLGWTI